VAEKLDFQMAEEAGGWERASSGLLIVGSDLLPFASALLTPTQMEGFYGTCALLSHFAVQQGHFDLSRV
jgi:hypothetical protein